MSAEPGQRVEWNMSNKKSIKTLMGIFLAMSALSGCGGEAYRQDDPGKVPGGHTGGGSGGGIVDPGNTVNFAPTYAEDFKITGTNGSTPSFELPQMDSDNILKVKVKPGPATVIDAPGYGFSAEYGCVSYTIEVMGETVQTKPMSVDGSPCYSYDPYAKEHPTDTEQVFDFSHRLTPGHGPITVKIKAARYDFYCKLLIAGYIHPSYYSAYCPMKAVTLGTHTVTGYVEVMVNGTSF